MGTTPADSVTRTTSEPMALLLLGFGIRVVEQGRARAYVGDAALDANRAQREPGVDAAIEAELAEYDLLKSGQVSFSKTYALEELPRVLVKQSPQSLWAVKSARSCSCVL